MPLDVRGINPRVERAMRGGDSDDDKIARRGGKRKVASRKGRASDASMVSEKYQSMVDLQASNGEHTSNGSRVVELRVSRLLLTTTVGSDDDGESAPSLTAVSPVKRGAISPSEEQERLMQAFRSARKIAVMERKAMQLAKCSDSDDDIHLTQPRVARSQRHAIEREVEDRMPGNGKMKLPASSITASELDVAEEDWVLVEQEDRPPPRTSLLTPLRGNRPIPSRRPSVMRTGSPSSKRDNDR